MAIMNGFTQISWQILFSEIDRVTGHVIETCPKSRREKKRHAKIKGTFWNPPYKSGQGELIFYLAEGEELYEHIWQPTFFREIIFCVDRVSVWESPNTGNIYVDDGHSKMVIYKATAYSE